MPVSERERNVEVASASEGLTGAGRHVLAAIGIDRYHHWQALSNAVRDAAGAAALFRRLGFEEVTAPLLDERATGKAIQSLVTDDLKVLGPEDSLVLFYAGHGGTRKHRLGGEEIKTGYLIPVDASSSPDKVSTWIDLEGWLRAVALLPAKHILVVLDACNSGIALDPVIKWRDIGSWQNTSLSTLRARRSRRIITSALDDQVALDSGPVHGHSLFTGCLIEGLTDGIARGGSRVTTGSELGLYVQRRVQTYPHARQTPDFGTFAFDDRGEMVIPLAIEGVIEEPAASEAVLPGWLDLIDLDDKPEPVSVAVPRPSSADSGGDGEVGSVPVSTAEPDLPPPAGAADKPTPVFDTGPRPDDADVGVLAEDVAVDRPQPSSPQPALNPMASAPPSPPPNPIPSLENVASIAPTRKLAEPASAERASTPTPGSRRRKRATPVLPPLPPPQLPAEIAKRTASTPNARRWIVVGAAGATLAASLIGYLLFGHESPRADLSFDTPPHAAASNPPDARSADASSRGAVSNSPSGQPKSAADSHAEGAPPDRQQTSAAGSQNEGTPSPGELPKPAADSHPEGSSPGGQPKTTTGSHKRGSSLPAGPPKSAGGLRAAGSPPGDQLAATAGSLKENSPPPPGGQPETTPGSPTESSSPPGGRGPMSSDDWFEEGANQYTLGNFDKAIEAFRRGYSLETNTSRKATFLYNIAQAYRQAHDCKNGLSYYRQFLALKANDTVKPLPAQLRKQIEDMITELEACAKG